MTEQEFLALPSREQDALVAETALGCTVKWNEVKHNGRGLGYSDPWLHFPNGSWCKCPLYTWSMESAWWLVPEMEKRDLYIDICATIEGYDVFMWDGGGFEEARASHKQAQLAVCVTILKAFGVITEEATA